MWVEHDIQNEKEWKEFPYIRVSPFSDMWVGDADPPKRTKYTQIKRFFADIFFIVTQIPRI
ncbi:hypothetical protein MASR1M107_08480 [Ignavibacteriales bacterium]